MVDETLQAIEDAGGRDKAMGYDESNPNTMSENSNSNHYLSSGEEDEEDDISGTMKQKPKVVAKNDTDSEDDEDDDFGSGTMVRRPKTSKAKRNDSTTPAFMKHIQSKKNVTAQDVSI